MEVTVTIIFKISFDIFLVLEIYQTMREQTLLLLSQVNTSKTQFMWLGSRHQVTKAQMHVRP